MMSDSRARGFAAGLAVFLTSPSALTLASPYAAPAMMRLPRKPRRAILMESERGEWSRWLDSDGAVYLRRVDGLRVTWYAENVPSSDPNAAETLLRRLEGEGSIP